MRFKEKNFTIVLILVIAIFSLYYFQFGNRIANNIKKEQNLAKVRVFDAFPGNFTNKINVLLNCIAKRK